jgi:hypothetical protein
VGEAPAAAKHAALLPRTLPPLLSMGRPMVNRLEDKNGLHLVQICVMRLNKKIQAGIAAGATRLAFRRPVTRASSTLR